MGSEVSLSNRKLSEIEQSDQTMQTVAMFNPARPSRSCLYDGESFYCPFIYGKKNELVMMSHRHQVKLEDHNEAISEELNDQEIDDKIEKAIADATKHECNSIQTHQLNFNCSCFDMEGVNVQSVNKLVMIDSGTNTSQPTYIEIAVGRSQDIMVDCATGMSQEVKPNLVDCATGMSQEVKPNLVDCATGMSQEVKPVLIDCATGISQEVKPVLVDCGAQTSQELLFNNELVLHHGHDQPRKDQVAINKTKSPILLPRGSTQTVASVIPPKMPRLDDLDRVNPIYSSRVTFDFDDANKENDSSVLRQRSSIKVLMGDYESDLQTSPSLDKENVSNKIATSSSGMLVPSRGPFLRLGLSKKSRSRTPLHPKTFGTERKN